MRLDEGEKQIIELVREVAKDYLPTWDRAYLSICKKGFFVSLTEESEFQEYLSWKEFEKIQIDSDQETFERDMKLLEKSIARMRKAFYAKSTLA